MKVEKEGRRAGGKEGKGARRTKNKKSLKETVG